MKSKITKRTVDNAQPKNKIDFIWDTEVKGFGLKILTSGRKVYILQFRPNNDDKTQRYTIGVHGSPWTPDSARCQAIKLLGRVKSGEDIRTDKKKEKCYCVRDLCNLYLVQGTRHKKQSTIDLDESRIRSHVTPLLGNKQIGKVTTADLEGFMSDIAEGKTFKDNKTGLRSRTIIRGGEGAANRTLEMLSAIFEFGIKNELLSKNPCKHIKKFKTAPKQRFLNEEEIHLLGKALQKAEIDGINLYAINIIKLLLFTGCRKGEILSLKWNYIDFENRIINLPDSKTGAKPVFLGDTAVELLANLPRQADSQYVFPNQNGNGPYGGLKTAWTKIRASCDLNDVRIHDLRHTFASIGVQHGKGYELVGKLLGHKKIESTKVYAHFGADHINCASDEIGNYINQALTGSLPSAASTT